MREKFSKRIQTIIKKSREEAVRMGHSYVGSEHLATWSFEREIWLF